jgi:hypothetical protein
MAPKLVEIVLRTHFDYVQASGRVHAGNQLFGERGYSIACILPRLPRKDRSLFYYYLQVEFDLILYDVADCKLSFELHLGLPSFFLSFCLSEIVQ